MLTSPMDLRHVLLRFAAVVPAMSLLRIEPLQTLFSALVGVTSESGCFALVHSVDGMNRFSAWCWTKFAHLHRALKKAQVH